MKELYKSTIIKSIVFILAIFCFNQSMAINHGFEAFGYPKQTTVFGPKSSSIFFFKQRNDLQHDGTQIHLEIVNSKVLDKQKSKILFFINDLPILTSALSQEGDTLKVDLPVGTEDFESGFLKLELKSDLFKIDDDCRDSSDSEYWIKITQNSHLEVNLASQFTTAKPSKTLDKLIPDIERLVIPRNNDLNLIKHVSYIHFFYKSRFGMTLPVSYLDEVVMDSLDRAMIIGPWDLVSSGVDQNVKVSKGQGELKILNNSVTDSLTNFQYYTSNILLTSQDYDGIKKVLHFLFDQDLAKSAISDHLIVKNSVVGELDFKYQLNSTYKLSELGLEEEVVYGACRITKNIQLPSFLTKNELKLISFQLKVNHKPIQADEQGYINIYLNNSLLQTIVMDKSGVVDRTIAVKRKPIRAGSYFSVEYVYLSGGDCCGENNTEFFAQIDPIESKINIDIGSDSPPIFSAFPENFSGKQIQLLTDLNFNKNEIPALSNLIGQINVKSNDQKSVYLPEFISLKDYSFENSTSNMIIITDQPQKFNALFEDNQYIQFLQDSISYHSDELEKFFTVNYNKKLTYAQIFPKNNQMVMLITHLSDNPMSLNNAIEGIYDPYLTNSGNVLLANDQHYYFFDLRDKISTNQKAGRSEGFVTFWDNYKLFIIILVLAFIIVLLSYIFRKSELAKTQIEDARK
ncbi:cellulose biosynthesis cyclic di-GMP-binding regulatory protein BcsB [Belliella sp. DSM 107340]|uniref:Cellulose biosynthesis cyclic di-GMP-binding regulatory protein BcsB n=1 Tax=Belliella calami TaxID=2923436 RepID=A0ABS9UPQ1_9BACT|nr:cellulose biosynthesis cyclic di-GMP-binding regulatory protein BcsB [Belliella calami]MCH7398155.1 cellulose biosynthesis cyclic di-GMP-binding regulatory protein BcsB [Belliella calami]